MRGSLRDDRNHCGFASLAPIIPSAVLATFRTGSAGCRRLPLPDFIKSALTGFRSNSEQDFTEPYIRIGPMIRACSVDESFYIRFA